MRILLAIGLLLWAPGLALAADTAASAPATTPVPSPTATPVPSGPVDEDQVELDAVAALEQSWTEAQEAPPPPLPPDVDPFARELSPWDAAPPRLSWSMNAPGGCLTAAVHRIPVPAAVFDLPMVLNARVQSYLDFFMSRGRRHWQRWASRGTRYLDMIRRVLATHGLPQDLVFLAMIESGFNPRARSRVGALGMWQFMRQTGRRYGLRGNFWYDDRRDPEKATDAAARHLRDLHEIFGDWYLAASAYNAGAGRVRRAIKRAGTRDYWTLCQQRFLPRETCGYVPKMLAAALIWKRPEAFGFEAPEQQRLEFDEVHVGPSTDLAAVASQVGVNKRMLRDLNPELGTWATPPKRKRTRIRVPVGKGEAFQAVYDAQPERFEVRLLKHKVRFGETPGHIAMRYGLSTWAVMDLAGISQPWRLRTGQVIPIPAPRAGLAAINTPPGKARKKARAPKKRGRRSVDRGSASLVAHLETFKGPGLKRLFYKVKYGDAVSTIAEAFDIPQKDLRRWNGMKGNFLRAGQVVQVYVPKSFDESRVVLFEPRKQSKVASRKRAPPPPVAAAPKPQAERAHEVRYTMRPGDSLWSIGQRFGVPVAELRQLNRVRRTREMLPGTQLTLRVDGPTAAKIRALESGR